MSIATEPPVRVPKYVAPRQPVSAPEGDTLVAEEALYEVVRGVKVELPNMSTLAATVASNLHEQLAPFVRAQRLGRAVVEALFLLNQSADTRRRPDVAFVSRERWPADRPVPHDDDGWPVVPDLAIEVISPSDRFEAVFEKTFEYLRCGVRQVWLVLPQVRQIHVYDGPASVRIWTDVDTLDGAPLLPGFQLLLAPVFNSELD